VFGRKSKEIAELLNQIAAQQKNLIFRISLTKKGQCQRKAF
jgi:hypothetical protein